LKAHANGKIERWHESIKSEAIRPGVPLSREDAERLIAQYITVYNKRRLHSSIGYITPLAALEGRRETIHNERDRKQELARQQREQRAHLHLPERSKATLSSQNQAA
jgi:putative transposase